MSVDLRLGDCRQRMAEMPDNSVDSIVCDPPYELGFMGKSWDASGIAYDQEVWRQALRVLKPGGHLLAFSGSRTYHWMACAIEVVGFEIRDQIMWVYGSGFPKSLDVSKAIDKAAGAEREVLGIDQEWVKRTGMSAGEGTATFTTSTFGSASGPNAGKITAPATDDARRWQGWGTALKPAHEPICVARKPLDGTVAANVLKYGTGAMNIDGCRVAAPEGDDFTKAWDRPVSTNIGASGGAYITTGEQHTVDLSANKPTEGRWPANFIHDGSEEATAGLGEAARFFYCAKASRSDREEGLNAQNMLCSCEATRAEWDAEDQKASIQAGQAIQPQRGTIESTTKDDLVWLTSSCGNSTTDHFLVASTYTTSTETNPTTGLKTCPPSQNSFTSASIPDANFSTENGGNLVEFAENESASTPTTSTCLAKEARSTADADNATSKSSSQRNKNAVRVCAQCKKLDRKPSAGDATNRVEGTDGMNSPRAGAGRTASDGVWCSHPTVKPTDLMRYLVRLVTPPGGTVLDPFMGSGSTGKAAALEGFNFIGIEMNEDYLAIAQARINAAIPPILRRGTP